MTSEILKYHLELWIRPEGTKAGPSCSKHCYLNQVVRQGFVKSYNTRQGFVKSYNTRQGFVKSYNTKSDSVIFFAAKL